MLVDQLHCVLLRLGTHDAKYRPEDLFLVDAHVGRHPVEQAAAEEEAVLVAVDDQVAAVDHELGTFLDAEVDVAAHLVVMRFRDQRPHVVARVRAVTDLEVREFGSQLRDDLVSRLVADADGDRNRHAALAAGTVGGAHQRADGIVDVGIGHDDRMVLRAAERLHALAVGRGGPVDVFGHWRRADEADGGDPLVAENGIDRDMVALDDIENAGRETGLRQQFRPFERATRVFLGRLQDEGVAAGDREREHPQRHHRGKIEWRDTRTDAHRLAHRIAVDASADLVVVFTLYQVRDATGELDDFESALDRTIGIVQYLAMLLGDQFRDLGPVALDEFLELEHDPRTSQNRRARPRRKGRLG